MEKQTVAMFSSNMYFLLVPIFIIPGVILAAPYILIKITVSSMVPLLMT